MNRQEQARIIASLTDDELKELTERAAKLPPPDEGEVERRFLQDLSGSVHPREWMAELANLFGSAEPESDGTGTDAADDPPDATLTDEESAAAFLRVITNRSAQPRRNP
ncbi:hypothetical protein AU192_04155 [Mycobacterium lehmannii]|uniref:Uncharacterized protein n=1 Tax=Mycobacterium lehmannii TaxID=2048550 RepID=A0A101A4U2_9MYCO|nr:hypothetical protein [Mycobacterium lehmannii]KUI13603.1 hypothetical protein AU192_04155 [Mycobacterium lehmannii]